MVSTLFPLLAWALTFNGASHPGTTIGPSSETLMNVAYGSDAKQKMDIYLPAERASRNTIVVVLLHGGGWNGGDKGQLNPYITELQKRLPGYAFANVNYRLFNLNTSSNRFPTQENDVKSAIDFLRNKSLELKVSQKIVLLGVSAGGHLALLQGYKNETRENVKAVVSFFGPSDLIELYNKPGNPGVPFLLNALTGTNPSENKKVYEQSSPIHFVTANAPPTLLLQGGRDFLVPENQSTLLRDRLQSLGVQHDYIYYPTEGHGWRGDNLSHSLDKVAGFLQKV